jgi:hypothetical protein
MSDWEEVTDGNENLESEFEGEIWKPEMVDEALIGKYVEIEENVGTNNDSTLYHIRTVEGELFKVWGSMVLDGLFQKVPLNTEIKLVYKGKKQSKKGFYYKVFKLFQKPGGEPSGSSSSNQQPKQEQPNIEAEIMDLSRQTEQAKDNKEQDWFDSLRPQLPKSKEDLKDPQKVAIEWINRIRMDLIDNGTKRVTLKMIRDNVNILWQEEEKDFDLGVLDEAMAGRIFKVLKGCEPDAKTE